MTDNEKFAEKLREAAKRAGYFQTGEQGLLNQAAEVIASLSLHSPTDDERSSEQQEEQRHGDRGADHEEQQTDDRAAAGRLGVAGSHASMMPQATSDGKRVISHTPTDNVRAIFDAIADRLGEHSQATNYEIADSGEYETKLRGPLDVEVLAEWLLPTVLRFRRTEVPEPSAEPTCDESCATCGHWAGGHDARGCRTLNCLCTPPQGEPSDAQVLETFLGKLSGGGAYTLDFTSAEALHGHIVSLLKRDIAALRAAGEAER